MPVPNNQPGEPPAEKRKQRLVLHIEVPGVYADDLPQSAADFSETGEPAPQDYLDVVQIVKLHDEVGRLREELAKATRERDSLARRCAIRFESETKLREVLTALNAAAYVQEEPSKALLDASALADELLTPDTRPNSAASACDGCGHLADEHGSGGCDAPLEMSHSSRQCPCRLTSRQVATVTAPYPGGEGR